MTRRHAASATDRCDVCGEPAPCPTAREQRRVTVDDDVAALVAIVRAYTVKLASRRHPLVDEADRYDRLAAWLERAGTMPDPTPTSWPCPLCDAAIGVPCFPPDDHDDAGRCHHWRGWSIAMCNLGDDLDADDRVALDVCAPTCEAGPAQSYRGACLGCPWRGPVVDDENTALEAAHDHTHPGWRHLPAVPSYPGDGSGAPAERKRRAAWLARVVACYPPGWFDVPYAPVVTRRRPMGTRHHPALSTSGYDLGVVTGGPSGDPNTWPPPDRRHPADATQEKPPMTAATSTATAPRTKTATCPECRLDVDLVRGKIKDHPAKDRPARGAGSKALCTGSGGKPGPAKTADATPPADETVIAPTLDTMLLEAARPAGAWSGAQAAVVDPALCDADPNNPRRDLGDLTELSMSLVSSGMIEPVVVAPGPADGRYTIVAGHRRVAAAIAAQLPEIPVLVRGDLKPGSNLSLVAQLVENLHRLDLSPLDEARAYAQLRDLGMKQADIASAAGVNQGQVSKRLALLKLPDNLAAAVGDRLDVATAVEVARLPAADRAAVAAELDKGTADPVDVVRRARAKADRAAEHQAIVDDLESRQIALVDFPTTWHWGRDREDRPLATGPDGEHQPYGGARTIDVTYADHQAEPCHGAAVSTRDEVIYVCLDPTRHGYKTAADEADELEAERRAADEAREAAAATEAAAQQARRDAARHVAVDADVKRPQMGDVIAGWVIDSIDVAASVELDLDAVVDRVAEWSNLEDPAVALAHVDNPDTGDVLRWQIDQLTERHGHQRLAYMIAIAGVDVLLDGPAYHRQMLTGTPLVRDHYNRLTELAGYELTDADAALLVEHAPVPATMPDVVPDDAVAWYSPDDDAALDGDEARFLFDTGELDAVIAAGFAHRVVRVDQPAAAFTDPAGTDEENTSTSADPDASLVDDADAAIAAADEANRATAAALDDPPPADRGDDLVPGERCPASRRDFNTPGNANGIPCPLKCGASVDTTATGRVRDHDVPEAS